MKTWVSWYLSAYGNPNNNYPLPSVSEHFNENIKNHGRNVVFHMVPKNHEYVHSYLSQLKNSDLTPIYDARPIYFIKPELNVVLPMFNAFANSSVNSIERDPKAHADFSIAVKCILEHHNQKKFHQIGSFIELKEISKSVLAATKLGDEAVSIVLNYL